MFILQLSIINNFIFDRSLYELNSDYFSKPMPLILLVTESFEWDIDELIRALSALELAIAYAKLFDISFPARLPPFEENSGFYIF